MDWTYSIIFRSCVSWTVIIILCIITTASSQLIPQGDGILREFRVYRELNIDLSIYEHISTTLNTSGNGQAECANYCINETSFICRAFTFHREQMSLNAECVWSAGSPNTDGRLAFLVSDSSKETYVRLENECDPFLVDKLPAMCPTPLGMKRGLLNVFRGQIVPIEIGDSQITASSSASGQNSPQFARYEGISCWKKNARDLNPWIQVDFSERHIVTGLVLQGCGMEFHGWVQKFRVESRTTGNPFVIHKNRKTGSEELVGNVEPRCGNLVTLNPVIYADSLRLVPLTWYRSPGLRFEILGCKDGCDYSLGLTDSSVKDAGITASSTLDSNIPPNNVRIQPLGIQVTPTLGWRPATRDNEWIQVRFREVMLIKSIITQGCSNEQSYPRNFIIKYSTEVEGDVENIQTVNYPSSNDALIFPANVDATSLLRHDIPQVVKARIVRVTPTNWAGGIQCMKMELIGCLVKECGDQINIGNTPGAIQVQGSLACLPASFAIFGDSSTNPHQTVLPFPAIIKVPLLINLGSEYTITGILIQGSINEPQYGPTWATKFTLQYAVESVDERSQSFGNYLNTDGSVKIFQANFDSVTPVTIYLDRPIVATKLYLTYYNDDIIYPRVPCIRVDFLGYLIADDGYLCGPTGAEAAGFCFTTVASRDDEACQSIFHSTSYPAIIKSPSVNTALNRVLPQIIKSGYEYYRIGLTHHNLMGTVASHFQWVDGTPLQFQLFDSSHIANDDDDELCPAIYVPDTEHWQALTCESSSQAVGTICQFDLDECRQGNSGCARDCINYPGGYACECPPGMYLNWWDHKGCESLCDLLHLTSLKDNFPDKCFEFHVDEPSTFDEASQICSRRGGTFVELWHLDSLARHWQGPGPFPVDRVWVPDVPTIRNNDGLLLCKIGGVTMNPNSPPSIWWSRHPCIYSLPFICVQDAPPTVILQPSRDISVVNTTETTTYMSWLGLPPWFDQLSQSQVNIRVESGLSIRIAIVNLRELDSDNCLDELKITEHLPNDKVFQHPSLCGLLSNFEVQTRSNVVNLVLKIGQLTTLESHRHLSLRLLYEAVDCNVVKCETICPSRDTIIYEPRGLIRTFTDQPYILPPAYICQWTIVLPPEKFVRLDFFQMWIEPKHPINVYLRAINQSKIDETQYVSVTSPIWLYSETNKVIVSYDTGITHQSSGFVAHYGQSAGPFEASGCGVIPREVHGTCPDTNCNQPRAFFGSPNYPQKYPNLVCKWTITTSPGTYVWVHVFKFDSAGDYKCREVYIETQDLDRWSRICGNSDKTSGPRMSRRNEFKMTFYSGNPNRYGNFHAAYEERYFETPTYDDIKERDKDFSCPAGWNLFSGRCFLVVKNNETLRWNEAHIHCLERVENNSDLVSIRNQAEMNFVHELLVKGAFESEKFYIGLTIDLKTRRYVWTDGLPLCYADWYFPGNPYITDQREPNGGDTEACSMIELKQYDSTKNWLDIPCADPLTNLYICAKPAHYDLQDDEGQDLAQPILTFHTESCGSSYFRIADKCLHMVFLEILKEKVTSTNVSEVCDNGSDLIGKSFVNEHFDQVKSYQEFVWRLYDHVIIDKPPTTNVDELPCIIPYASEIVTCDSSQIQFALCVKDAINLTQHCKENQFECESGECVNILFVNDLKEDCADGSDEKNFGFQSIDSVGRHTTDTPSIDEILDCSNPSFMRCDSGDCIHARHFCDFQDDCFDRSDEKYCIYPPCNSSEFQCDNGQCIPLQRLCDLLEDCVDRSDEMNCVNSESIFQCYSGQSIPKHLYCDGHRDCSGKVFEDEPDTCDHLKSGFICDRTHQLACYNRACRERDNVCMMYEDAYGYPEGCRDVTHLRDCAFFECTNFTFKCEESYCIPQHFKCNGRYDCPGKEDEMNCDTVNCTGAYRCHHSKSCVAQHLVCDGIRHCPEGDDEESCDHGCPSGCSCYGVTYTCSNMLWDQSTAARTPRDIKQLHLSFLSSRGRFKRDSDPKSYSIEEVTFLDLSLFPFLLSLDLSGNGITFLGNGTFASTPNLRFLNLSFNEIYELDSSTFTGLLELQVLDLSGNKNLKHAFGSPFLHLNKLRQLYLQDTALVTSADDFLLGLDNIETFHSERFYYCCLLSGSETLMECLPTQGDFSSCSDLIRHDLLRIAMWILGMSALCGNLAVILWRVFRQGILKRRKRNPVQALLVVNLAIADLFMGCYMLFIAIADVHFRGTYALFSDQWQTSFFCRFAGFLSTLSSVSSVMFLTVISFDRYLNVVYPFSRRHLRFKSALVVACGVWMIVTLIGVLPALIYGGAYYGRSSVCLALPITAQRLDGWYFSFFIFIGLTLVLFMIIVFCYISIFIVARRSSKAFRNDTISDTQQKEEQLQMALKVAFLVGTDFVCWVPIIFMGFLSFTSSAVSGGVYAWTAVFVLPINSSLNPYLYTFLVERASRASKEKAITSTMSTRTITEELPQAYPMVQQIPNQSLKETITGESDVLKAALVSLRATRLMTPLLSDKYKKLILSSLMTSSDFILTDTDKEDILMDLTKALDYLHNLGVAHGDVSENSVVIDQSSYGNKRAFLLKNFDLTYQEMGAEGDLKNEDRIQQDQSQLRDLKARLRNIAVESSDKL